MELATRARGLAVGTLAGIVLVTSSAAAPPPVDAASPADRVIAIARAQLGDPWVHAAKGPNRFDCSGLVIYAFQKAGLGSVVGNGRFRSAYALYDWFRDRGLTTRSNPHKGDLVIWGRGSHVGIYIGGGKAISTLTSGVTIHRVHAVTAPFTAYLRTGLSSGGISTAGSPASKAPAPVAKTVRLTTTALRMRAGPSTAYRTLDIAPRGDRLIVTKSARDRAGRTWYFVWSRSQGRSAWVAGWFTR